MELPAALELPGWAHTYSGKVRDLYVPDAATPAGQAIAERHGDVLLLVASNRISAYDFVLDPEIPGKGTVLTQLSLWWFQQFAQMVPSHVVCADIGPLDVPSAVAGRALITRRLEMFPVECVVRGYLTGSGLAEYRASGAVTGVSLPDGLVDGSQLPEPIFTPATKAALGDHDENVPFEHVVGLIGEADAQALRDLSLQVYRTGAEIARQRGIILADTKFEFGRDRATGEIVLADEVLTPDSSRFWDAATWQPGAAQASFDKQYVRDWLTSPAAGWDRASTSPPPALPADVVVRTAARYNQAYQLLTGSAL